MKSANPQSHSARLTRSTQGAFRNVACAAVGAVVMNMAVISTSVQADPLSDVLGVVNGVTGGNALDLSALPTDSLSGLPLDAAVIDSSAISGVLDVTSSLSALPGGGLPSGGLPDVNGLTAVLGGLNADALTGALQSLDPAVLTDLVDSLAGAGVPGLPSLPTGGGLPDVSVLTDVLNSLDPAVLNDVVSGLDPATLTGLLNGLDGSTLPALPGLPTGALPAAGLTDPAQLSAVLGQLSTGQLDLLLQRLDPVLVTQLIEAMARSGVPSLPLGGGLVNTGALTQVLGGLDATVINQIASQLDPATLTGLLNGLDTADLPDVATLNGLASSIDVAEIIAVPTAVADYYNRLPTGTYSDLLGGFTLAGLQSGDLLPLPAIPGDTPVPTPDLGALSSLLPATGSLDTLPLVPLNGELPNADTLVRTLDGLEIDSIVAGLSQASPGSLNPTLGLLGNYLPDAVELPSL